MSNLLEGYHTQLLATCWHLTLGQVLTDVYGVVYHFGKKDVLVCISHEYISALLSSFRRGRQTCTDHTSETNKYNRNTGLDYTLFCH